MLWQGKRGSRAARYVVIETPMLGKYATPSYAVMTMPSKCSRVRPDRAPPTPEHPQTRCYLESKARNGIPANISWAAVLGSVEDPIPR